MIAEPGLRCAECGHIIQPGRLCLSELPEETPASVSRSDFRNYCVGCPECWRQGRHACYARNLEAGGESGNAPRNLPCVRCGRRIRSGDRAGVRSITTGLKRLEPGSVQQPEADTREVLHHWLRRQLRQRVLTCWCGVCHLDLSQTSAAACNGNL